MPKCNKRHARLNTKQQSGINSLDREKKVISGGHISMAISIHVFVCCVRDSSTGNGNQVEYSHTTVRNYEIKKIYVTKSNHYQVWLGIDLIVQNTGITNAGTQLIFLTNSCDNSVTRK